MRELPPQQLAALLKRLGLATEGDFERVEATVHRIAGSLPRFESVWIDALRQARCLTHFQAAEIHAGRGEALAVARYVLLQRVFDCGYSAVYRAEDPQTREIVRLAVFSPPSQDRDLLLAKLESLSALGKRLAGPAGLIVAAGLDGSHGWAASPWVEGTSLADFVLHHGRFPPQAVLEIARAMLGELVDLELVGRIGNPSYEPAGDNLRGRIGFHPVSADDESKRLDRLQTYPTAGLVHGDIRMQTVLIANDGEVHIPHPGLRGLIRPHEGMSCDNLAPDACSTLAPERVTEGTPPTTMSDLFACGCVWWHLLCGRPPLGGGDARSRLLAAQAAAIDDLQQWAADVPGVLVEAIGDCLQKDPRKRPQSMADLAQRLGPLRRSGRQTIARCLAAAAEPRAAWLRSKRTRKKAAHPHRVTAAALLVMAGVAVAWPLWVAGNRRPANTEIARHADPAEAKPQAARSADSTAPVPRELSPRPMIDSAVTPAGYSAASGSPDSNAKVAKGANLVGRIGNPSYQPAGDSTVRRIGNPSYQPAEELRLPTDRPVRGELLQFKPGQRVRAQGGRAKMVVPREGLAVQAERVLFENIDFVVEERADRPAIADQTPDALIRVLAAECDFADCSFQSPAGSPELVAAIVWQHASSARLAADVLPAGRIRLNNCVFRRVGVGIESHRHGAVGLELVNSLCLGPGPMIRLMHAPAADEPVRIRLAQVTLREAESLLDCRGIEPAAPAGEIGIEATGCVFAPRTQAALLVLTADAFPGPLLHEVNWNGQGSVVAGQVVVGRWCGADGACQTVDDATLSIAGLVRGEVEFAGRFNGQPANSQVVKCQAPLRDTDSAGAAARDLPPEVGP